MKWLARFLAIAELFDGYARGFGPLENLSLKLESCLGNDEKKAFVVCKERSQSV